MQYSTRYIFFFCAGICLVCSVLISTLAVALRPAIARNGLLEKRRSVLYAAWLAEPGEKLTAQRIDDLFKNVVPKVIDLETGDYAEGIDPATFNPDTAPRVKVSANPSGITDVPTQIQIYHVMKDGKIDMLILPIYGKGLWGTLYGYIALQADADTVAGLTYYSHKETPGLGAEVDNPRWKGLWPGREIYDENGEVAIHVIKGAAGAPQEAPHEVDGLSGATLTSRGVTNMLHYWFSDAGYGPYLKKFLASQNA